MPMPMPMPSSQELVKQTDQWAIIRQADGRTEGQAFSRRKGKSLAGRKSQTDITWTAGMKNYLLQEKSHATFLHPTRAGNLSREGDFTGIEKSRACFRKPEYLLNLMRPFEYFK